MKVCFADGDKVLECGVPDLDDLSNMITEFNITVNYFLVGDDIEEYFDRYTIPFLKYLSVHTDQPLLACDHFWVESRREDNSIVEVCFACRAITKVIRDKDGFYIPKEV